MSGKFSPPTWQAKFTNAFRGFAVGVRGQSSFRMHAIAALTVFAVAWWLEVSRLEWCLLLLCATAVFAAELFNTAIEYLARAITDDEHPQIRDALDVSAAAVLVAALGAATVGAIIFAARLLTD